MVTVPMGAVRFCFCKQVWIGLPGSGFFILCFGRRGSSLLMCARASSCCHFPRVEEFSTRLFFFFLHFFFLLWSASGPETDIPS